MKEGQKIKVKCRQFVVYIAALVILILIIVTYQAEAVGSYITELPFKGAYKVTCTYHTSCYSTPTPGFGVDFTNNVSETFGDVVYASGRGTVTTATDNGGDWGKTVVISHPDSYRSRYAHMEYQFPYVNQKMREGSPIGYMGHTGTATGDHLHFQTYYNTDTGQGVDPGPIDGVAVGGFYKNSVYSNSSFNTTMRLVDNTDGSPFFTLNTVSGCPNNTQNGYHANGLGQPAAFFRHCAGTTGTPTRTGRWKPALASSANHHIYVFIPRHDGITLTGMAKYKIYSNGVYLGFILINQRNRSVVN